MEGARYSKIDKSIYLSPPTVEVRCKVVYSIAKHQTFTFLICKDLTIFHLKSYLSSFLKIPRSRIRLLKKPNNIVMDEKSDKESIKNSCIQFSQDSIARDFTVEIQESDFPLQSLPSYSISNHEKSHNRFLEYMNCDEGTVAIISSL